MRAGFRCSHQFCYRELTLLVYLLSFATNSPREWSSSNLSGEKSVATSNLEKSCMLHIVLFQPEIPQNTGNIGRTCVALGAKLWLVEPLGFRIDATKLKRAGMDYWESLQWESVKNWQTVVERLAPRRMWLITKFADSSLYDQSFADEDVFVFGSESSGVPASIHDTMEGRRLRIPMTDNTRSLNLATSAGIVAYEAYRQLLLV